MVHCFDDAQSLASPTFSQLSLAQASDATTTTASHVSATALPAASPSDSLGPVTPANALGHLASIKAVSGDDLPPASAAAPGPPSSSSSDAPASAAPTVVGVPPSSLRAVSDDDPPTDVEMDDLDRLPPLDPAALIHMPNMPFQPAPPRRPLDIPSAVARTGLSPRVSSAAGLIASPRFLLRSPAASAILSPAMAASVPANLPSAAPLGPVKSAVPPSPLLTCIDTVGATPALSEPDLIPTQDGREEVIPSDGPLVGPPVETLRALAAGSDARSAAVRAKYARHKRESIAQGRQPGQFLTLSAEQKTDLFASIGKAKKRTVSDANKLPLSTGRRGIPRPIPTLDELQSIQDDVRRRDQWRKFGLINDEVESDSGDRRPSLRPAKGKMLRSIPCLFVSDIGLALPFYREVLGFVNATKPEKHMAMLCRTPAGKSILRGGEEGVQILLRTSFGPYGVTPTAPGSDTYRPVPTALWIEVENVDELFDEVYTKCRKTDPVEHSYFPMLPFGQARMLDRPQNTPFGTREIRVHDPDANMLIFFQELRPEPPLPTDTKVRGPVFRPRVRGRGRR